MTLESLQALTTRLTALLEILTHSKFSISIKDDKNVKDADGITLYDKVMLSEYGSAIQGIQASNQINKIVDDCMKLKSDKVISDIYQNVINQGWSKNEIVNRLQSFAKELEIDVNSKLPNDLKGSITINFKGGI